MNPNQLRAMRRKYYLKSLNKQVEQSSISGKETDTSKRLEKEEKRKEVNTKQERNITEDMKYLEHSKNKILYTYDEFNKLQLNHIAEHKMIILTAIDSYKKNNMKLAVKAETLDEAITMINEINTKYLEKQEYIVNIKEIKGEKKEDENNI